MKLQLIALVTLAVASCGKKKEDETKYGFLKAKLANQSTQALTMATAAPSELKVRLKYILVIENKTTSDGEPTAAAGYNGNNVGKAIKVWVNPKCTSTTVNGDGSSYTDILTDEQCDANGMEYFDLNRTSELVNADLNSQAISAEVGTYRYVTMAFLGEGAYGKNTLKNIKWAHANSSVTTQEFSEFQVEFTGKFATPIELTEGQSITFNLAYDLGSLVTTGLAGAGQEKTIEGGTTQPGKYNDCDATKSTCITLPSYTLSVVTN